MSDHFSISSPGEDYSKPSPSIFGSSRSVTGFSSGGVPDPESSASPTSILDGKPFLGIGNPFSSDKFSRLPKPRANIRRPWEKTNSRGVGLVDALTEEDYGKKLCRTESRTILFGPRLKIHIPPLQAVTLSPSESPASPTDFGIKTSKLETSSFSPLLHSPSLGLEASVPATSVDKLVDPRTFMGCLPPNDMELSEDYTRVISHGPNPKTTHIFNNCIVENCRVGLCAGRKENGLLADQWSHHSFVNFLSSCYACKKMLGPGKDIYMYRDEKAFCSLECRRTQEILFDDGV